MQKLTALRPEKAASIGLVELPARKLIDPEGRNWTEYYKNSALLSKQVLLTSLQAGRFDAQLVDLRKGDYEEEYGSVNWRGMTVSKRYEGTRITSLDPHAYEAWGVTNNFMGNRQLALMVIQHLARGGRPVVVGGSDAIAEPQPYLDAGAAAIVTDKSGGANWVIFDKVLLRPLREDSHEDMLRLEEAISELLQDLKTINPSLGVDVSVNAIIPIPGTPQGQAVSQSGLLRFDDPEIVGGWMTASSDTKHMSYEEVSDWQLRLFSLGDQL